MAGCAHTVVALALAQLGKPIAAAIEAGITRHSVLATRTAPLLRDGFDGSGMRNNPTSLAAIFNWNYGFYMIIPWNIAMFNITSAPSAPTNTPTFDVVTGPGNLLYVTNLANCIDGATAYTVWLTNITATAVSNGTMNVT